MYFNRQYLPVRALHFGDTGTPMDRKEGRYSLGPLECDGDTLFENVVTFRKSDAVIELPTFEMGQVTILGISVSAEKVFRANLFKEDSDKISSKNYMCIMIIVGIVCHPIYQFFTHIEFFSPFTKCLFNSTKHL
jgi:hypothetical protein